MRHPYYAKSNSCVHKNRLQDLLHRHQIIVPAGDLYGTANRAWWDNLPLSPGERLRMRHLFDTIERISVQIAETENELAQLSVSPAWRTAATLLIQLPGIGMINAMTILSAIGTINRFATAKKLVGYAGLGAKVHASGKTNRGGALTKQGRTELRRTMVEAAWTAVGFSPLWKQRYQHLAARIGKMKAITAIARKLLIVVWHVLTNHEADRFANSIAVQRSLLTWASRYRLATSLGLSRPAFVEQALLLLGLQTPTSLTSG